MRASLTTTDRLPENDDTLMSDAEVAAVLRVSPRQVGALRQSGRIAHTRLSERKVYIRAGDVREFLRQSRIEVRALAPATDER